MDVAPQKETYSVGEAKQRLRHVAAQFDPLAFIKRRPLRSLGTAFLAGVAWGSLRCRSAAASLLPLTLQTWALAERLGLAPRQR